VGRRRRCRDPAYAAVASDSGYARAVFILVAILVLSLFALQRLKLGYPKPTASYAVLSAGEAAFLSKAAETLFPESPQMARSGTQVDLPAYADGYLATLPKRQRLLVRALFMLFEQGTLLFPARGVGGFRRFSSMNAAQRASLFEAWDGSSLHLRRTAIVALKAVLIMGYFGHAENLAGLGMAPFEIESPICEADLLYPPIGEPRSAIPYSESDLTADPDTTPLRAAEAS
jgi:hypothetical protein